MKLEFVLSMFLFASLYAQGQTSSLAPVSNKAMSTNDKIVGVWLNEEKDCRIKVYREGSKYYGKIVWLDGMDEPGWKPVLDDQNPDPEKRKRPLLGLMLLTNFEYDKKVDDWRSGEIYDPRSGKLYKCFMKLNPDLSLKITGYIGAQWMGLGESTRWTKYKQ